jgi:SpoIID/LytB domain protein/uncharacterized repeat protein (TIGR01451 family)
VPVPFGHAFSLLERPVRLRSTRWRPRRRASALVALALALSVFSPATGSAASPKTFTFYGSGYGHGLGLPQWGAYGLAKKGWSQPKILGHFYTGTKVGPAPSSPSGLRVGLVQNAKTVHVSSVQGTVALRVGSTSGKLIGGRRIKAGQTWRVLVAGNGRYRVLDSAGKLVGNCPSCKGHLWGGVKTHIFAVYAGSGKVRVSESGHTYNRGHLEFNLYGSKSCSKLSYCERLIIVLIPQSYLYGLAEVPSSWPMTALEVQAVAARTYAFEKVKRLGQHRPVCNCGLYDDTGDQVYAGWDKEGGYLGSRWVTGVQNTNRMVVLYNGAPIQAYYHSASGGFTENNELQWGGSPLPYLRGVCDPGDYSKSNPNTVWRVGPLSDATVTARLRPYTGNIGTVTKFANPVRGVSGRMVKVTVVGTTGQANINGTMLRRGLGLKDNRVWINANRQVVNQIRARYDKLMCAPGLATSSQQSVPGGIRQRFAIGGMYWNQSRSAVYWIRGPVYDKYRALGESGGLLGMPRSDLIVLNPDGCSGKTCAMARFEQGNVYFKEGIGDGGAHELHGYVLDHYVGTGEAAGHLGFPTTDVTQEPDGSTWAKFENGATVTCSPSGECVEVGGPADLSLQISDSSDPLKVGSAFAYVVTVRNAGPGKATNVVLTEQLPPSVKLLSWKPSQGSCKGSKPVKCSLGSVKRGARATVKLVVKTTKGGSLVDAGSVDGREPDPRHANDSRSIKTLACTHMGTAGPDVLRGSHGEDVICGLGGEDTIYGFGGNDIIYGGPGNDLVNGGSGADRIYGGPGVDKLYGGWGADRLLGGPGNDSLDGNRGIDTCLQGPGTGPRIACEH